MKELGPTLCSPDTTFSSTSRSSLVLKVFSPLARIALFLLLSLPLSRAQTAEKLELEINTEFDEQLPLIAPDGRTLFFSRKRYPMNIGAENKEDIWVSYLDDEGRWGRALNMGFPLNDPQDNFVVSVNPAGNTLYLGNQYRQGDADGISISRRSGRSWSAPKAMPIADFQNDNEQPSYCVGPNERILIMAVERPEGLGGLDLYVSSRLPGDYWGPPRQLGTVVNTPGNESSPFLAADGRTLYFASDGHQGYGKLDMFVSRRLDDSWTSWSTPENLGPAVNTVNNDYNYTIPAAGDFAYFASEDETGQSDLYRLPLPSETRPGPVLLVSGRMIDGETQQPVPGKLKVEPLRPNVPERQLEAGNNGSFQFIVPYGQSVSLFPSTPPGYFPVSDPVEFSAQPVEEEDGNLTEYDLSGSGVQSMAATHPEIAGLLQQLESLDQELTDLGRAEQEKTPYQYEASPVEHRSRRRKENNTELAPLRERFEQIARSPSSGASGELTEKGADRELADLKEQYRRLHSEPSSSAEPARPEEDHDLTDLKDRYNQYHYSRLPEGFDELEAAVRQELTLEMLPSVKKELGLKLYPSVRSDIRSELSATEQEALSGRRIDATEIFSSLERNLPAAEPAPAEWPSESMAGLRREMEEALREEVREELKKTLEPQVREELRQALSYQVKLALEAELRQELEDRIRKEVRAEYQGRPGTPEMAELPEYREIECDILLVPIRQGQIIPLNNIFFDANQTSLKPISFRELDRVREFLQDNPDLVVEVGGHTNSWCSHSFAKELSEGRAQVVAGYFIEQGIDPERLQYRGYGKVQPIASNDTAEGRKKNQRVELKILRFESGGGK